MLNCPRYIRSHHLPGLMPHLSLQWPGSRLRETQLPRPHDSKMEKNAHACLVKNSGVPSWYGIIVLTLRICWTNRSSSVPRFCLARMRHDETINMFETTWEGFQVSPQHILDKIHFSKCDQCAFPHFQHLAEACLSFIGLQRCHSLSLQSCHTAVREASGPDPAWPVIRVVKAGVLPSQNLLKGCLEY